MLKPKRLEKGDTIGIISPASSPRNKSKVKQAIKVFEGWGYKVKLGKYIYDEYYYLAGRDKCRVEDLNKFFADDAIDAIFCSTGGYGAMRILKDIRYDVIKKNPKIFLGFSDITALHLAIHKMTGLVTFHGPIAEEINSNTGYIVDYLNKALFSAKPIGTIEMASRDKHLVKIVSGKAKGRVVGGNLTLVCSTLGTPYEIDTKGKIVFLEEVQEAPYRVDRYFSQLLNAGKLQEAVGIVIGECVKCESSTSTHESRKSRRIKEIIFDLLAPLKIPIIYGLPIGHTKDIATIPIGVEACLDASRGEFSIDEVATTP